MPPSASSAPDTVLPVARGRGNYDVRSRQLLNRRTIVVQAGVPLVLVVLCGAVGAGMAMAS